MKRSGWVKWVTGCVMVAIVVAAAFCWVEPHPPLAEEPVEALPVSTSWREIEPSEGREVQALMATSTAFVNGKVNYKKVLEEDVYFPTHEAFLPWDEVMYLVKQLALSTLPAIRKLEVEKLIFLVQNDVLYLRLTGRVPVGNKLLRLVLGGKDALSLSAYLKIRVTEQGTLWVEDMQLDSPQIASDSTWHLACRYLTGEGDYLALARGYVGATVHLGRVGLEGRTGSIGMGDEGLNLILNTK